MCLETRRAVAPVESDDVGGHCPAHLSGTLGLTRCVRGGVRHPPSLTLSLSPAVAALTLSLHPSRGPYGAVPPYPAVRDMGGPMYRLADRNSANTNYYSSS